MLSCTWWCDALFFLEFRIEPRVFRDVLSNLIVPNWMLLGSPMHLLHSDARDVRSVLGQIAPMSQTMLCATSFAKDCLRRPQ